MDINIKTKKTHAKDFLVTHENLADQITDGVAINVAVSPSSKTSKSVEEKLADKVVAEAIAEEIVAEAVTEAIVSEAAADTIAVGSVSDAMVAEAISDNVEAEAVSDAVIAGEDNNVNNLWLYRNNSENSDEEMWLK